MTGPNPQPVAPPTSADIMKMLSSQGVAMADILAHMPQSTTKDPLVNMGGLGQTVVINPPGQHDERSTHGSIYPDQIPLSQASYWLQQQLEQGTAIGQKIIKEMQDASLVSPGASLTDILRTWEGLSTLSAINFEHGGTLTPMDYIGIQGALNGGKGGAKTSTRRDVSLHSTADLVGAAQTQAQQDLGRRLTPAEASANAASVHALEAKNPQITTGTTVTDALGALRSEHSVTSGGLGASGIQEALTQQDMAAKDYGAYQAAGRYFPVLLNAIQAINGAGA